MKHCYYDMKCLLAAGVDIHTKILVDYCAVWVNSCVDGNNYLCYCGSGIFQRGNSWPVDAVSVEIYQIQICSAEVVSLLVILSWPWQMVCSHRWLFLSRLIRSILKWCWSYDKANAETVDLVRKGQSNAAVPPPCRATTPVATFPFRRRPRATGKFLTFLALIVFFLFGKVNMSMIVDIFLWKSQQTVAQLLWHEGVNKPGAHGRPPLQTFAMLLKEVIP